MSDQRWFNAVAAIAVLAVLVVGAALLVLAPSGAGTPRVTSGPASSTVYRNLTITFNPTAGTYDYSALALAVPTNVRVVFTITNYDPSTAALPSASDAVVSGTYDSSPMTVTVNGLVSMTQGLPVNDVSHTFSMSDAFYHLNVPIPPASSPAVPSTVTFSAEFRSTGTYAWGCIVLCGTSGMMDRMAGYLTVN